MTRRLILALMPALASILALGRGFGAPALAQDSAGLCAEIVAHYKQLAANPPAAAAGKFYSDSPLSMLGDAADSGVILAPHIAETGKAQRPLAWAQHQGLKLAAELQDALDKADFLDQLPGTNFYAAGSIQGTASCYDTTPFVVTGAQAKPATLPPNWMGDDVGSGCGVFRMFGKVETIPVAFEENYDYSPALTSTLTASAWAKDHFDPACTASFTFEPRFSPRDTYNDWDQSCTAANCDDLRQSALTLVEAVQSDPVLAQKQLLDKLTDAQRADFEAMEKLAQASEPDKIDDPAQLLDSSALALPLVVGGQLYLAHVGHFTIGWRNYSDWSVKLDMRKGDEIRPVAEIAIGMTKGKLKDASVK
ncbi:MAG: hypothetical protein ABSC72_07780 [Methylovirgula sp.]|jgi:hypothetical protein